MACGLVHLQPSNLALPEEEVPYDDSANLRWNQLGINIDVHLRPLKDDLKKLWFDGADVLDESKRGYFQLYGMLFCMIQDLPTLYSVSGQTKVCGKGCP